jgi:PAS domain S-box-containing protein
MRNKKHPAANRRAKLDVEDLMHFHIGGVMTVREDGTILGVDEGTVALLQKPKETLEGKSVSDFMPELKVPKTFSTEKKRGQSTLRADGKTITDISYLLRGGWHQEQQAYFLLLQPKELTPANLRQYARLYDWMPVGILIYDLEQATPVVCNQKLLDLFSAMDENDFLKNGPLSTKHDNPLEQYARQAQATEQHFETELPTAQHEKVSLQVTSSMIPGLNQQLVLFLFQNITDRNLNARRLQESRNTLSAIISSAVDGIIIIDGKGTIKMVNEATSKLFGYNDDEMIGRNINMLMPEPHHSQHDGYLDNYKKTGDAKIIGVGREVKGKRKDGKLFPFRLGVSRVNIEGGMLFTGVVHDLTEQKRQEAEIMQLNEELEQKVEERTEKLTQVVNQLLQSNQQLEQQVQERQAAEEALRKNEEELRKSLEREKELSELKSRFVSMASHEFRTPLTTIASSTELLGLYTESEQQPKREKHLKRIKSSVTNLTGILTDFLSLSKLEEGKIKNDPDWFNLCELLDEIADDLHSLLKNGQTIRKDYSNVKQEVYLDAKIVKNVFINLLSNAIKYSNENSTVHIQVELKADTLHASIRDEGIGIPKHEQKHLFSRFFRADNVENIQGTGLGLNIVKRYINLLDGSISFESEEGKGTTFIFDIPLPAPENA